MIEKSATDYDHNYIKENQFQENLFLLLKFLNLYRTCLKAYIPESVYNLLEMMSDSYGALRYRLSVGIMSDSYGALRYRLFVGMMSDSYGALRYRLSVGIMSDSYGALRYRLFVRIMGKRSLICWDDERSLICWDDERSLQGLLSMFLLHY
jgi:hypothetical protein